MVILLTRLAVSKSEKVCLIIVRIVVSETIYANNSSRKKLVIFSGIR